MMVKSSLRSTVLEVKSICEKALKGQEGRMLEEEAEEGLV